MKYPESIPPDQLSAHASDNMLLFTAGLAIVIGVILVVLGHKGRQLWLVTWSIGLIVCSVLLGVSLLV